MELRKITEEVFFIPSSVNIGVIKDGENAVILVDSGLDDNSGKKVLNVLKEHGFFVKAIINTHSHADHCGGNRYIQQATNAQVYAPELEAAIIENPLLEPMYFFSGAAPIDDLRNKFLMAQPSSVDYIIKRNETRLRFNNVEVEIVSLPGHSANQIGIVADNVLFCADSVFSKETLEKHKIPFNTDIEAVIKTLDFLQGSKYRFYVPSHALPCESLTELIRRNQEIVNGVERVVLEEAHSGKTTEQILRNTLEHYHVELKGAQQFYLMNTVIMAYLSHLQKKGELKIDVEKSALFWRRA